MSKQINSKLAIAIIAVLSFIVVLVVVNFSDFSVTIEDFFFKIRTFFTPTPSPLPPIELKDIKKFSSKEEFQNYLKEGEKEFGFSGAFGGFIGTPRVAMPMPLAEGKAVPDRVSETTVQVPGIDEPDIVKTDGKEIYFSPGTIYYIRPVPLPGPFSEIMPRWWEEPKTKIITAFPPDDLGLKTEIDKSGNLLLTEDILVIFSNQVIYGYDVSDPTSPQKKWEVKLENNTSIVGSRLYKNKIYLITKTGVKKSEPCPIRPLTIKESPLIIPCQDIYHPVIPVFVDATFTAIILEPQSGEAEKKLSFVGSTNSSVLYMSGKAIYVTYAFEVSTSKIFLNFIKEKTKDLLPSDIIAKIEKVIGYDISEQSKVTEIQLILQDYLDSLTEDEKLKTQNEFSNRMADYAKAQKRELEKTGIVKIDTENLQMIASGPVPGSPLNQFSLDEYQDNLRVATTIGQRWRFSFGFGGFQTESANDVYVLDNNLKILGSVQDLGITERIYSVRFIEDKGYVVTFRQIDPFYVLDLADPKNPELKGELKIPGYSSYLHPITKDKILGIGMEGSQVKISLFDVSSPSNPKEKDKYILDEYWSEVLSNFHAFLLDTKHNIFFLPGSKGGYIFSYQNDKLALQKAVSETGTKRAIYINDYLYIIGEKKITVLNEINWEKVKELEL